MTVLGEESKGFPDELKSGVVKYLSTVEAPVVVDCGSGSGNVSSGIKTGVPKAKVFNFDLYPQSAGSNGTFTTQADLNDPIPIVDAVANISISQYLIRYLEDPISHINELVRATKKGGFVVVNGVSSIRFDKQGEECRYFTDWNDQIDPQKAKVFVQDDWIVIQVLDESFRLPGQIDQTHSYTIKNNPNPAEIMDKAHFVYKLE